MKKIQLTCLLLTLFLITSINAQKTGINTTSPEYTLDIRGTDDSLIGGDLQLSTPNQTNFLRLFGGRLLDRNPFIAFHDLDTFHLVTTLSDFSTYTRRMTMLPNGSLGLGTDLPAFKMDIRSNASQIGSDLNLSNPLAAHFLRFRSHTKTNINPGISWKNGMALQFFGVDEDGSNENEFVRLDGKTIGIYNTGASVFVGENAGQNDDLSSNNNIGIGRDALKTNVTGVSNVAIGGGALQDNTGVDNTAIGRNTLRYNDSGNFNVALGHSALLNNVTGDRNTMIGVHAGQGSLGNSFSGNVFIGYDAGLNETNSNRLYISNSASATPLLYGEFDNSLLKVNGTTEVTGNLGVGVTNPSEKLHVGGNMRITGLAGTGDRNLIVDSQGKFKVGNVGIGDSDWVETNDGVYNLNDNIGMGVSSPAKKLTILTQPGDGILLANPGTGPFFLDAANLSIETNKINVTSVISPDLKIQSDQGGNIELVGGGGNVSIGDFTSASKLTLTGPDNTGSVAALEIRSEGNSQKMLIDGNEIECNTNTHINASSGQPISIGSFQIVPGYAVSVSGKIIAEEVRVQLQSAWPDYVFKADYELMPLKELDASIKQNGHLPGIPKASLLEKEGIDTGEMQRKMMEKIEELTLHMIRLNNRIASLESENEQLKEHRNESH